MSVAAPADGHYLYVAAPGVRNYLEYGGAGLLVFDVEKGHQFVRRIETPASRAEKPENIKGVCASAASGRLYFTTPTRLYAIDLSTDEPLWDRALPLGCDRMSIVPDGSCLYVPSFERDTWNVVDGATGDVLARIETKSGAHNTVCGSSGKRMYLAGLRSPLLSVADTKSHTLAGQVGPFSASIRPFTVNRAETRVFACVNELLGFEIGDLESGKMLARVEVAGFSPGPVKRHGCPSHGIGLTPDETQVWVCDAHNQRLHAFDITSAEPRQLGSIALRDEPGWVTFSIDGRFAYSSTGELIDPNTRKILVSLADEEQRPVQSEKMLEIYFSGGKPVKVGDQFGVGRKGERR
jgi:DNA-binding beta-propeller fold protein YncE